MSHTLVSLVFATNPLTEHLDKEGLKLTPVHSVTKGESNVTVYIRFGMMSLMKHWLKGYKALKYETTPRRKLRKALAHEIKTQDALIESHEDSKNILVISEADFENPKDITVLELHTILAKYLPHL
jgi:hypothetical protein